MPNLYYKISLFCFLLNTLVILFILTLQESLPPVVPLFYGLPVSADQLVKSFFLLLPPIISSIFIFTNSFLIRLIKDDFIAKVLTGLNIGTVLLSAISISEIIFLVT